MPDDAAAAGTGGAHQGTADRSKVAPLLPSRIPSLDGLRGASILLVVAGHVAATRNFPFAEYFSHVLEHFGNFGVRFFFVISGFLITTLLLKEHDKTGRISLRAFYVRRSLRIFPAFYVYWAAIAILALTGAVVLCRGDLLHAATYTMNYHHVRAWQLNHIWSLAVEEQFYLLWPTVLYLFGPTRSIRAAAGVILAVPLVRLGMWYGPLAEASASVRMSAIMREFQAVADVLATGCVMAGAYNWLGKRPWYMNLHRSRAFLGLPAALLLISAGSYFLRPVVFYTAGQTCATISIALIIDHFVRFPAGVLGRLLNSQFLRAVGILSYSLYLWQELFLDSFSPSVFTSFPQNLILTGAAAVGSYYLVERPALRLKSRFEDARRRRLEHAAEITAGATER